MPFTRVPPVVTSCRVTVQCPHQDTDRETTHMSLSLPRELCSLESACSVLSQAVPRVGSHIFHHSQDSELFQAFYNHIHPAPSPPSHPRPYFWTDTTLFSISIMLSFLECHINGILQRGTFWDWLLFTQLTSLESHGSGHVDGWFALIAGQCCGCAQTTL